MTLTKPEQDEILRLVALELMYNNPQKWQSSEGPTAQEIAKRYNLKVDVVKKKLRHLQELGIARYKDVSPKRWEFDVFNFNRMHEDDPISQLINRYDDDDYLKFTF